MLKHSTKFLLWSVGLFLVWSLAPGGLAASANASDAARDVKDIILVLDASGSMWGQIDGVNKIVIARDVVEGLVRNLPPGQRFGFVAYGHRRKGDCSDIETLAHVGTDRGEVIKQLRAITPVGKTPLTRSVEHAANELDYTRNAATVILVSDGLETCDADPCALARSLEENGLDFTVHVIGFNVTEEERAGLQCIAEETGGEFLAADDAEQLAGALNSVAVAPGPQDAAPLPSKVVLKATIMNGGPQIDQGLAWAVTPAGGGEPVFSRAETGVAETEIAPGDYQVRVTWNGWRDGVEKTGTRPITVREQNVHVFTVPIDLALPVTLRAPAETGEGQAMDITWSGPDDLGAVISVNRPDDGPMEKIFFFAAARARQASKKVAGQDDLAVATLAAPTVPGDYEIRYTLNRPSIVLARRPLRVTDNRYRLEAPAEVPVSTGLEIEWSGPLTPGDLVTLVPRGDERPFDNGRYMALTGDEPATLTTPAEPGDYEIRYVMYGGYTTYDGMQHSVQASIPLTVTEISAGIEAPATAVGGSTIEVGWTGPAVDWQDDFISVVAAGAAKYNRDSWDKIADRAGEARQPATIRVPAVEGEYEVVYVMAPGNRIMARSPIIITRARAAVEAPDTVKAGEDLTVAYSGDGFDGDRVVVCRADVPDAKMWGYGLNYGFAAGAGGSRGVIPGRCLSEPGVYEVRYVTGLQHQVLARDKLTVVE